MGKGRPDTDKEALEIAWRAGYGEAIRRIASGETTDEMSAWESVNKEVLVSLLEKK